MSNLLLAFILTINLAFFAVVLLFFFRLRMDFVEFRAFLDSIYQKAVSFTQPIDDKTPSPLEQHVQLMAYQAGKAIASEVKTTIMGKLSGISRAAGAAESELAGNEIVNAAPGLAGLLPAKTFKNNKLMGFLSLIAPLLGGNHGNGSNDNPGLSSGSRYKF